MKLLARYSPVMLALLAWPAWAEEAAKVAAPAGAGGAEKAFGSAVIVITIGLLIPLLIAAAMGLTLLIAAYQPTKTNVRALVIRERPVGALVWGLLSSIFLIAIGVGLISTNSVLALVGALMLILWIAIAWAGFAAASLYAGGRLMAFFGRPEASDASKVAWGCAALALSKLMVPLGTLVTLYAALVGIGATVLTALGKVPKPPLEQTQTPDEPPAGLD